MKRREFLGRSALLAAAVTGLQEPAAAQAGRRVFRWAFNAAETGFDPAQVSDLYSNYVISNIIESPLQYDYLARPAELRPRTAAAMPEVSSDFRTLTIRIRPGIVFQDDPAFKGQRRELTAHDYVYSTKRIYDPRWKSPRLRVHVLVQARRTRRAAQAGPGQRQVRLRARGRGTARARPLHLPDQAGGSRAPVHPQPRRQPRVRRRGTGSRRAVRRRNDGASGRHRAVRAGAMEALLVHRARAQPDLSRGTLRRTPAGRRRARPSRSPRGSRAGACLWSTGWSCPSSRSPSRAGCRS